MRFTKKIKTVLKKGDFNKRLDELLTENIAKHVAIIEAADEYLKKRKTKTKSA